MNAKQFERWCRNVFIKDEPISNVKETTWWKKHSVEKLKETNQERKKLPFEEVVQL